MFSEYENTTSLNESYQFMVKLAMIVTGPFHFALRVVKFPCDGSHFFELTDLGKGSGCPLTSWLCFPCRPQVLTFGSLPGFATYLQLCW